MRERGRQRGETLVETIITVVLLGLLATGIVTAMASIISVSDLDAKQSAAETVLRSYAQAWERVTYVPCTADQTTNPYPAGTPSDFDAPSGFTVRVSDITFWDGTSSAPVTFVATCPSTGDAGLQSLELEVDPPLGPVQTLTIEKRRA